MPDSCSSGDVRLLDDGTPEYYLNGDWYPICGHYFWDNDHGATAFCRKLGSTSGLLDVLWACSWPVQLHFRRHLNSNSS